jgi:pimeloyl-ACP methyl ester carboxylesterase
MTSRIAPGLAEREAARLFLTPRRRRAAVEPALPDHAVRDLPEWHPGVAQYEYTLTASGLELAAWSWGNGPTVLLVHGWEGSAGDMVPLAGALVRSGYRTVLFDLPAHGRSGGKQTSLIEWIAAIHAVADLSGDIHAVIGHSFGGAAVTLALAEKLVARGAVLVAPATGESRHYVDRFASFVGLAPELADGMIRRIEARVGRPVETLDARRAAAGLRIPALIIHDPRDREVPWQHGQGIAAAWTGSRVLLREGAGHRRILSDRRSILETVEFVQAL